MASPWDAGGCAAPTFIQMSKPRPQHHTWNTWRCSFRSYYPENMNATVEAEPTTIPVDSGMSRNTFRPNFWSSSKISRSECVLYPRAKFQPKIPKQATPPPFRPFGRYLSSSSTPLHCSLFAQANRARIVHCRSRNIVLYEKAYLLFKDRNLSIIYYLN